jgi:hypothetical protein
VLSFIFLSHSHCEVRELEYIDWEAQDDLRGRKVLSRYILDSYRNVLTRRPLSCFSMHTKTTKHMGVSWTEFQEVLSRNY